MELKDYREQIDQVDNELVRLFQKRMDLAEKIGAYKRENGLPVLQSAREREKLTALSAQTQPELQAYVRVLYSLLFELSRTWQSRGETCAVSDRVMAALESTPRGKRRLSGRGGVVLPAGLRASVCRPLHPIFPQF